MRFRLVRWQPGPAIIQVDDRARIWLVLASVHAALAARERAPVRTGRLRRSIVPLPLQRDRGRLWTAVWASAPYALWVEIGTRRMAAQPFLRPAAEEVGRRAPRQPGRGRRPPHPRRRPGALRDARRRPAAPRLPLAETDVDLRCWGGLGLDALSRALRIWRALHAALNVADRAVGDAHLLWAVEAGGPALLRDPDSGEYFVRCTARVAVADAPVEAGP